MSRKDHMDTLMACPPTERERANAILASCADKPIKRLDAAYWVAKCPVYNPSHPYETREDRVLLERERLVDEIRAYLHENGATTGAQLARALKKQTQMINAACKTIRGILSQPVNVNGSGTLWMMPVRKQL